MLGNGRTIGAVVEPDVQLADLVAVPKDVISDLLKLSVRSPHEVADRVEQCQTGKCEEVEKADQRGAPPEWMIPKWMHSIHSGHTAVQLQPYM